MGEGGRKGGKGERVERGTHGRGCARWYQGSATHQITRPLALKPEIKDSCPSYATN